MLKVFNFLGMGAIFRNKPKYQKGPRAKCNSICLDFESMFLGPYISDNNISGILLKLDILCT